MYLYSAKSAKSAKSDCTDQLFSYLYIKGTDRFYTLIFLLFTCMLTHVLYCIALHCIALYCIVL